MRMLVNCGVPGNAALAAAGAAGPNSRDAEKCRVATVSEVAVNATGVKASMRPLTGSRMNTVGKESAGILTGMVKYNAESDNP
jgi:hypothetical protein